MKKILFGFLVFLLMLGISLGNAQNNTLDSLKNACYQGDVSETICSTVNDTLSEYALPVGVSASCVWNPGEEHSCTAQINLDVTSIVDTVTSSSLINSMEFIQSGSSADDIVFYSEPFTNHQVHVIANGSLFPTSTNPEFWMEVSGISNILAESFDFSSINPDEMTSEQISNLESQYSGYDNVSFGMGFAPDLSVIKSFQEFTWNLTISYDEENLAGVAACDGNFSGNACSGDWIDLQECQAPGTCSSDSYLMDYPSEGEITVFGADPVPVYGDTLALGDVNGR